MHCPELDGNKQNMLETTIQYKTRARLTPTLTHVVMYVLVTSGAEDNTMSIVEYQARYGRSLAKVKLSEE
jgi:hypothetical protein